MRPDRIILITCLFCVVQACSPIYTFCMEAAKDAVSACTKNNNDAVCKCSAEKQVLACYADCEEGDDELDGISNQMNQVTKACASAAAEAEALVFGTAPPSSASSPEKSSSGRQKAPSTPPEKHSNEGVHAASIPSPIRTIDSFPAPHALDNTPEQQQQAGDEQHETSTTKSTSDAAHSLTTAIVPLILNLLVSV